MRSGFTTTYLLDANILIALSDGTHSLHARAVKWFETGVQFATCPITQGALIRVFLGTVPKASFSTAKGVLKTFCSHPRHVFWPDNLSYVDLPETGLRGKKQVTDAYLAELARKNGGLLATMDTALAALHTSAVLI